MALSLASLRRKAVVKPQFMVLYGVPGVGKSTLAAGAPAPVFAAIEDGLGYLDVPNWQITSYADLMDAIGILYSEEHDRKTFVVDSADWAEPLIQRETMRRNGWDTFDQPYGKGPAAALVVWRELLDGLRALRDDRGIGIIILAHEKIIRFDAPDSEPFDTYKLKLHDKAADLLTESADLVGFVNYRVTIRQTDVGFNKKIARGVGGGQRVIYLEERPAYLAKNRWGMPPFIDLPTTADAWKNPEIVWAAFAQHLPGNGQPAAEAA